MLRSLSMLNALIVAFVFCALVPIHGDDAVKVKCEIPASYQPIENSKFTTLLAVMGNPNWKHGGYVSAVAMSPDGRFGISGGHDGVVLLWDLSSGEAIRTLATGGQVCDLGFFPDGKQIFIAQWPKSLKIVDVSTGKGVTTLKLSRDGVRQAKLFPDGKSLLVAPYRYPAAIYDKETGEVIRTFSVEGRKGQLDSLALAPDGNYVLVGMGNVLDAFDTNSGKHLWAVEEFERGVSSIAVASSGKTCVAGSRDGIVRQIDLQTGEILRRIKTSRRNIEAVAFTQNDECVFTGDLINLKNGQEIWPQRRPTTELAVISLDEKRAFTSSHHCVGLQDLDTGKPLGQAEGDMAPIRSLAITKSQVVSGGGRAIRFWDECGRETHTVECGPGSPQFLMTEDAKQLMFADYKKGLVLVDLLTDKRQIIPNSARFKLLGGDASLGRVVGVLGRTLQIRQVDQGSEPIDLIEFGNNYGVAVAPMADLALVFSSGDGIGLLELWDLKTGEESVLSASTTVGFIKPLRVSADGAHALTAPRTGMELWDLHSGKVLQTFQGHYSQSACYDPSRARVYSASANQSDRTVRIFDSNTGELLDSIDLGKVNDTPQTLLLSADGQLLLVGTARGVSLRFQIQ